MILDKSIEMMKKRFDDRKFVYGERPETAFEGVFNAYVHVPFCMSTCDFCPFYKELYRHVKKCGYLKAILTEIAAAPMKGNILNLHFGGGTPNLLSVSELGQIIAGIREKASIGRISLEALPSLLSEDYLMGLKDIGVEALHIGLESFSSDLMATCGRRSETIPHFMELIQQASKAGMAVNVNLLAGMPNQRETSFVEDVHLIGEMCPTQLIIQPLIQFDETPDERIFELVELAADILLEKGYHRQNLWTFVQSPADEPQWASPTGDIDFIHTIGFGPSAYSRHETWQAINPETDLYIYEQLYGKSRVLWRAYEPEDKDWHMLAKRFYRLDGDTASHLPPVMNWYIRWLQLSGIIKNNTVTEKGRRYAHHLVHAMISTLPHPIQDTHAIENLVVYEAEKSFASIYISQMEDSKGVMKTAEAGQE